VYSLVAPTSQAPRVLFLGFKKSGVITTAKKTKTETKIQETAVE